MTDNDKLDQARLKALNRIDGAARNFWVLLIGAFAVELLLIWGFIQLADFSDRTHVLIFWSMLCLFTMLILSLTVLATYMSRQMRLLVTAIGVARRRE